MASTRSPHTPLRSCISCGTKTAKRDLIRIVATPEGAVVTDTTGKQRGRGGYLCRDQACIAQGLRRGRLEYALRTKLRDEHWEGLASSLEAMRAAQ